MAAAAAAGLAPRHQLDVQAQQAIPVTGMTTGINNQTGERPARWEVNVLQAEGRPQWYSHYLETQFVAWHRLYVALYEQVLGAEVQRIASEYSGHQNASTYWEAGQVFRQPYWDWASNPKLPPSCTQKNITKYPLNQNQFPGYQNFSAETTRASNGASDFSPDVVNANLALVADELRDLVYRTFTYAKTFDQMSSMADPAGVSFEASHNIIHNAVGGSFAIVDITAFDPLFVLHHANLDRLAALWMAVHSNATYQSQSYLSNGLYATARGDNITAQSPLKPFYRADGRTFHTGLSAATLEPFGYTYPELRGWNQLGGKNREQGKKAVISRINDHYGPAADDDNGGMGLFREEWFVQVTVNRSELELPCNIDVYVGEAFSGRVALLGMPMHGLAHAKIPLQRTVRGLGSNITTDRAAVQRTLLDRLRVEIQKVSGGGPTIEARDIASLELELIATDVTYRSSRSEFPKHGKRSVYTKVVLDQVFKNGG
ncbi:Di-copper centre-containing protein [Hypoxylon sp. FL0890]|nr:Di-copper centre-containing protein [Hypoxylon sp. FL0890]